MSDLVTLLQQARYAEALSAIHQQLQDTHTPAVEARLLNFQGFAYEQSGELNKALTAYLQAESLIPHEPEYANNIALAYMAAGSPKAAEPYFEKVLRLKPDAQSHMNYALFFLETRDFFRAFLSLEQSSQLAPQWVVPQSSLYSVVDHLVYVEGALLFLQNRLHLSQESAFCLTAMGIYYHLQEKKQLAENYFKLALRKDECYLDTYRYLISLLQNQKNFADALNWALRFHEAEQSFNSAKEILASLQEPIPMSTAHIDEIRHNLHVFFR